MYVFKKKWLIVCVALLDFFGGLLSRLSLDIFGGLASIRSRARLPERIQKILLIRLDHIGDVLFTTPALRSLRASFPEAKIDILVSPWGVEVVRGNPSVDEVIVFDDNWFNRERPGRIPFKKSLDMITLIKKKNYDLGIDFRGDLRNILLMSLAGIKFKLGYDVTGGGFLLSRRVPYLKDAHEISKALALVKEVGCDSKFLDPEFFYSQEEDVFVQQLLKRKGVSEGDRLICIHPGAGFPSKRWPSESYASLIDRIENVGIGRIFLVGTGFDSAFAEGILAQAEARPVSVIGETNLKQLAALLKKCAAFVGNDSGPAQIAAALGTPSVILFSGSNDKKQWGPYGENVFIVQKEVECSPCARRVCPKKNHECMEGISVDEVLGTLQMVVNR